jgi:hypothetical protein
VTFSDIEFDTESRAVNREGNSIDSRVSGKGDDKHKNPERPEVDAQRVDKFVMSRDSLEYNFRSKRNEVKLVLLPKQTISSLDGGFRSSQKGIKMGSCPREQKKWNQRENYLISLRINEFLPFSHP